MEQRGWRNGSQKFSVRHDQVTQIDGRLNSKKNAIYLFPTENFKRFTKMYGSLIKARKKWKEQFWSVQVRKVDFGGFLRYLKSRLKSLAVRRKSEFDLAGELFELPADICKNKHFLEKVEKQNRGTFRRLKRPFLIIIIIPVKIANLWNFIKLRTKMNNNNRKS